MVMRGGLVVSAGCALHCARIVCDAMRAVWLHSRAALRCTVRGLFAMRCDALRCAARCADCLRCNARGLVAFARYRRRHAFGHG